MIFLEEKYFKKKLDIFFFIEEKKLCCSCSFKTVSIIVIKDNFENGL
jgi:hypothetical protein